MDEPKDGQPDAWTDRVVTLTFRPEREMTNLPTRARCPSVLVVEDSSACADATGLLLRAAGARVRWADCMASALRHLRSFAPLTVIVDPGLPDGSGLDLIARLRALGEGCPRIVVISGDEAHETAARDAGADRFLLKPVPAAVLLREILIDRRGGVPDLVVPPIAAPALVADLQRARLDVLRAALSTRAEDLDYPMQFLRALTRGADLGELHRMLDRVEAGRDSARDLAAALARMIDAHAARGGGLPPRPPQGPGDGGLAGRRGGDLSA